MRLRINGAEFGVEPEVGRTLAETLREDLGLTGTKIACGEGHCGACTVLVDAFVRCDALQCGFCTPGQIVSAAALVEASPSPSQDEIRHAMAGNLCRCGTYPRIEEAIQTWRG